TAGCPLLFIRLPFLLYRYTNVKCRAAAGLAFKTNCAVVRILNDFTAEGEPDAAAFADRLRAETRLEDLRAIVRGDSAPGVFNAHPNASILDAAADRHGALTFDRLSGVDQQIEKDLTKQSWIAFHFRDLAEIRCKLDPAAEDRARELDGVANQLVEIRPP